MARVVGDIAVTVGADVSGLERGMNRAGKSVDGFNKKSQEMAKRMRTAGLAVAAAAATIGFAINKAARTGREIQTLSRIAGVSASEFQKLAAAAQTVGFSQEKVADIFKDVNDKFGDFMANGAGPLKDFFENIAPAVGVTADQFANLSGPQALQLYVDSLEKAGVSQQQMTFYMEALANDATALIPLLKNGGREMKALGDEAERAGRILSDDMIDNSVELDRKLDELASTLRTKAAAAVLEYSDEIIAAADWITDTLIPAIDALLTKIGALGRAMAEVGEIGDRMFGPLFREALGIDGPGATAPAGQYESDMEGVEGGGTTGTGLGYVDDNGNWVEYGASQGNVQIPGVTAPSDEFQRLQEFRERLAEINAEFDEKDRSARQQHADAIRQIDEMSAQQRLHAWGSMFGDLATLMATENEKLFKIGQAAAIAEATVSGLNAATEAWNKGMRIGGPPVAAAFTAASLAKTGALISSIASASIGGRGGGGAAGGGGGSGVAAQEPAPIQQRNLTLIGDRFNRRQIIEVAEFMNDGTDNGLVIGGAR